MGLLREFYRRLMGNDGWFQIGQIVFGLLVAAIACAGFLFGRTVGFAWFGALAVFAIGFHVGAWMERRRIAEALQHDH